jgi:hypothetical protein
MQDAEDGDAGLHQELPVASEKAAGARRPIGFLKHQASLIVARNDIAQVIDRLPGERENPHVAERVSTQLQAPGGVLQEHCLAALLDE